LVQQTSEANAICTLKKDLYRTLQAAAPILIELLSETTGMGIYTYPIWRCVANKNINTNSANSYGRLGVIQSHVEKEVVEDIIRKINHKLLNKSPLLNYLGYS